MEILDTILKATNSPSFIVTSEQRRALQNMQSCRTLIRGGIVLQCPECKTTQILYHPCNQRGCPICYKKNQILWKTKLQKRILPTSHFHLVFSVPQVFTTIWLRNKKTITNILFSSISKCIKELGKELGILFGSVLVFQSKGKGLCYKPHVHCILTAGGLNDAKQWVDVGSIDYTKLKERLCSIVSKKLVKAPDIDNAFNISAINKKEWSIYPTFHHLTGKDIVEYLSHSMSGVVIDMEQNFKIDNELNTIGFSEIHAGKKIDTTLSTQTFIERYLNHIPPAKTVTVRYYGFYSNRNKKELEIWKKKLIGSIDYKTIAPELITYICPTCKSKMHEVFVFRPFAKPDFSKYGFLHGPPKHGSICKIA